MKVTLMAGIAAISGSVKQKNGKRVVFKTYRRPSAERGDKLETRMYMYNARERTTPLSKAEKTARSNFSQCAKRATELMKQGLCHDRKEAWRIAKMELAN